MIYYFSGTGNSKYVAEQIAKYTNDTIKFIPEVFNEIEEDIVIEDGSTVGVIFPIYAWRAPEIVVEFLSHVHVGKKSFKYVICTCGSEPGKAMKNLSSVFAFDSAYSIVMPENYVALFDVDEKELEREKLNIARQMLPKIALEINACKEVYEVEEGGESTFKTSIINPLFSLFFMRSSMFSVDKNCESCASCEKNCPFGVISIVDKKPTWNGKCQMCMSCINKCPVHAIQCGFSKNHGRYVFPNEETESKVIKQIIRPNDNDEENDKIEEKQNTQLIASDNNINTLYKKTDDFFYDIENNTTENNITSEESVQQEKAIKSEIVVNREEESKLTFQNTSLVNNIDKSSILKIVKSANIYSERQSSVLEKSLGIIYNSNVLVKEFNINAHSELELKQNTEQILYIASGVAKLIFEDKSSRTLESGDVAHFSYGKIKSVINIREKVLKIICVILP